MSKVALANLRWPLEGIVHVLKIAGGYAPVQSEVKVTGGITHKMKSDDGDYGKFLKEQNAKRIVVDGEIVEEKAN